MIGSKIGSYEITAKLGEGGMGEVFRARDTRLEREVALKFLPRAFTEDAERLARFEREAKLLAQLNHPGIAAIHGFEEAAGVRALVMELVEGPTLAERLEQGALAIEECLSVARQIAEALETAHEKGIIHRDLKPQNIKVTAEGQVKVLDFGLAKAMDFGASSPTSSPTLTARGTAMGTILGTAAYMAPEQAKGKPVDRRADIWAFGVVLWECLTGKPLFAADTVAETIGHVMTREPDPALLPDRTPAALRDLVSRCLVRDPRRRLQAIGDARIALEEIAARPLGAGPGARAARPVSTGMLAAASGAGAIVVIAALAIAGWLRPSGMGALADAGATSPRRVEIVGLSVVNSSNVAISPDGREVIGYDMTPSRPALLRRSLDSFEVQRIPGADNSFNPFYSPDGGSIGFFSDNSICVMTLTSSTRRCLAPARGFASGSWGPDGTLVYSDEPSETGLAAGLWRVSSAGGEPVRVTSVDGERGERLHVYPQVLPDSRNVIFSILGSPNSGVAVVALTGGAPRMLLDNASRGRFLPSGHLVYWDQSLGRLRVVAFDSGRLAIAGTPVDLGFSLATTGDNLASYDVSGNGTLVYSVPAIFGDHFAVETVDRKGQTTSVLDERASWAQPRVSPDGRLVLLRKSAQPNCTLWLFDLERRSLARVGLAGDSHNPLWLADGGRFLVSLESGSSSRRIMVVSLGGGGEPQELLHTSFRPNSESVSPDGRFVALTHDQRRDRNDILVGDVQTGETIPFLVTDYDEDHPAFSPDGTLLAYASNDSGRSEVYVRPFPGPGAKYAVSTHGGTGPVWSRDGRELFYAEGSSMMRVAIQRAPLFSASAPERLFESAEFVWERPRNYDVLADGSGFVIVRRGKDTPREGSLRVVFDWFAELERLAPTR